MRSTLAAGAVAATALGALLAPAADAASSRASDGRPRSRVVTYERDGLAIGALQMALRRRDGRLHGTIHLIVRNTTGHTVKRTLSVGRCSRGAVAAPVCEQNVGVALRLAPGATRELTKGIVLRQPPPRQDSVEAALVPSGTPTGVRRLLRANAELLLKGSAWRGAGAGLTYGATGLGVDAARRLNFDIPATSSTSAYMDVVWTGSQAPSAATTTLERCAGTDCTSQPLTSERGRTGPQRFGTRVDVANRGADRLRLSAATPDGVSLFGAELPWAG